MLELAVMDVPLRCINEAATHFHIPAKLIISILQIERGKSGETVKNKNRTYDIGSMGINSLWLPELKKYGITENDIQFNPCNNVMVGTWILSKKIASCNNLLTGIGDYNSHHYPLNKNYYDKVKISYTKTMILLSQ